MANEKRKDPSFYEASEDRIRPCDGRLVLVRQSVSRPPERTDAMARTVIPAFTDYVRDVAQFREFERELLVLVTEAQRE